VKLQREEQAQKLRDLQRAQQHFAQVKQDVQTKQLQIDDHRKKDFEMQTRYVAFLARQLNNAYSIFVSPV